MNRKRVPHRLAFVLLFLCPFLGATAQQSTASLAIAEHPDTTSLERMAPVEEDAASDDLFEALTITGQVRHRSEMDRKTVADPVSLHLLRTRLNAAFRPTDDVTVFVQVQDSRLFGGGDPAAGRGTLDGRAPALDLHQAYFAVTHLFNTPLRLKVGRQELAYGNQRLIGSVGWSNVGRTFDAGVLGFSSPKAVVDLIAARLVDDRASAQSLLGVYATFLLGTPTLDVFALHDNNTADVAAGPDLGESVLSRSTVGTTLRGKARAFDYEVEAAYQFGKEARGDRARSSIAAYLVSVAGGVTIHRGRIGALYTILSGDDDPDDDQTRTFNTLFATNHKFYGALDLFPFHAAFRPGGLHDAALRTRYAVSSTVGVSLDLHHFRLAQDPGNGTTLGQEADLTVQIKYNDVFGIVTGASVFVASDQAEAALGTGTSYWLFLATTVSF